MSKSIDDAFREVSASDQARATQEHSKAAKKQEGLTKELVESSKRQAKSANIQADSSKKQAKAATDQASTAKKTFFCHPNESFCCLHPLFVDLLYVFTPKRNS